MKMQTFFLVFATLALLGSMAHAATIYDNSVSLANISVSPNPIVAGSNVTISFQLYNAYGFWVYGATLQPTGSYPLLNVSPLSNNYQIGKIDPGINAEYYNYTIHIPDTTPSGVYTITFASTYLVYAATGTQVATSTMPVSFYVQNKPQIKVSASSSAKTLYAGYNQTLSLSVENIGYGGARNISIAVDGTQGLGVLSSVKNFFISNLTQGSSVSETVLVSAQNISNTYLLANVSYYSSTLKQHFNSLQKIQLSVAPSAQFAINSTGTSPGIGATDVPIHFKVTNTGTIAATELQLNLQTSYPITPVASTTYISEIAPGASVNVTFLISTDTNGVPGTYPVTLYEQWKQASGSVNQQFTGSNNYYVEVGRSGSTLEMLIIYIVIAIVVVGGVIFGYNKFVKSKKRSKK